MDEFRLCVSVDGRVAHLPCSSFYSEAGTCSLSFDVLAPVVLPRPLLCTSSDDAVPFDTLAAIREFGALPSPCTFELQVTSKAAARELRRRHLASAAAPAVSKPPTPPDGIWRSLSPGPVPHGSDERLADMEGLEEREGGALPTSGRFGLWVVSAFSIAPESPRQYLTPPLARARSNSVGALNKLEHRRSSSPVRRRGSVVPIDWSAGAQVPTGSFTLEADGMLLTCFVARTAAADGWYELCITNVALFVVSDAPLASVFELANE